MAFDIHQLDELDWDDEDAEEAQEEYREALLKQFFNSPEGRARLEADPGMGFWAAQLIDYGHGYIGVSVAQMSARDVEEIVADLFPRKVSMQSPEDADDTIPELIAFWEFLKRQYMLANADSILCFLRRIEPKFRRLMCDSSRFGMAKSLFMMGQEAGFDMTRQEDLDAFTAQYNAALSASRAMDRDEGFYVPHFLSPTQSPSRKEKAKKKKRRKMAKASRKRNRRK